MFDINVKLQDKNNIRTVKTNMFKFHVKLQDKNNICTVWQTIKAFVLDTKQRKSLAIFVQITVYLQGNLFFRNKLEVYYQIY